MLASLVEVMRRKTGSLGDRRESMALRMLSSKTSGEFTDCTRMPSLRPTTRAQADIASTYSGSTRQSKIASVETLKIQFRAKKKTTYPLDSTTRFRRAAAIELLQL